MDHLPYSFFYATKMVTTVALNAAEVPMTSVIVHARGGKKEYKMMQCHVQVLESPYCNTYFGLNLVAHDGSFEKELAKIRGGEIPKPMIKQLTGFTVGTVATPPPEKVVKEQALPVPKATAHICTVFINEHEN